MHHRPRDSRQAAYFFIVFYSYRVPWQEAGNRENRGMATSDLTSHTDRAINGVVVNGSPAPQQRLHRIADVRRQQGISLRSVARQMNQEIREVKLQEEENCDLRLSDLYRWQAALEVPIADLLVDDEAPLSAPVMERARMVKLMKTAAALHEKADSPSLKRMAETLLQQLIEIMPELKGVSPWHAVGQRRTLDEVGKAVERGLSVSFWNET